jgi:hypothetical protein
MEKATGGSGIQGTPSHQYSLMDVETGSCLRDEHVMVGTLSLLQLERGSSNEACG